ncbi:lysozyme inhibitor LprI family protein [Roseivirga sp. BDSF3-8]|uniref:lysozyme inhibitor LprI family protein n=1 Tax=Roseivirga sp. BDSF3-8 TaxID=3241598 RepID=UPI003531F931
MKRLILLTASLFITILTMGQDGAVDLDKISLQAEANAIALRKQLEAAPEYESSEAYRLSVEYRVDTFRVVEEARLFNEINYSTSGYHKSYQMATEDFDALLNKYYRRLMQKMHTDEEKQALKEMQRAWIALRDKEKAFNAVLWNPERFGGGTMWGLVAASENMQITRRRVDTLYAYLHTYLSSTEG